MCSNNSPGQPDTLLRLLEGWRQALDNYWCVAAILMDLSKAFDSLLHRHLGCKIKSLWIIRGGVELFESYSVIGFNRLHFYQYLGENIQRSTPEIHFRPVSF